MTGDNEKKFNSLEQLSKETLRAVKKMGLKYMTDIQSRTIPTIFKGMDVRGTAKTGSGKTLAFLIPVVELIRKKQMAELDGTGAIVISPTRELAIQIYTVLQNLMEELNMTYGLVIGGTNRRAEAKRLCKGVNILIATPGKLLDHLQHTFGFCCENLSILVIDEADRIFEGGFADEVNQILKIIPRRRQTLLFSATNNEKVDSLTSHALSNDLVDVNVDQNKEEATVEGLTQYYMICPAEKRFLVLYSFIKKHIKKKVMVFMNTCLSCKFYCQLLNYIDFPVKTLHGHQSQAKRTSVFHEFKDSESGVLLCTDIAARGWDIPAVDWIIQFDPPRDIKEYIHRVGRTARAGGEGRALLILRKHEIEFIRYLRIQKVNVEEIDVEWSKISNIQRQLELLVSGNEILQNSAKKAFKDYSNSYQSNSLKEIFDIKKLDMNKLASCFGFTKPPYSHFNNFKKEKTKQPKKKRSDYGKH